jgi:hypothetical protein
MKSASTGISKPRFVPDRRGGSPILIATPDHCIGTARDPADYHRAMPAETLARSSSAYRLIAAACSSRLVASLHV